ncbi:MAG: flagellar export chaperone FlgN [Clostridia bacterium]|nr:flagellar export chaperone FlgN [Clostridia bacterium]MBQ3076348.1 flagellar export chaperone FlgN [Clostridia bacterium]
MSLHTDLLALLGEVGKTLDRLSDLAMVKVAAVRRDDLMALDEVLRQEQALALALRGLDQKRDKLLAALDLTGVPLSALADHCPKELQQQAREVAGRLRQQYELYQTRAEVARNTLEMNLHEIERVLDSMGVPRPESGGYQPADPEPPRRMKTDFRA